MITNYWLRIEWHYNTRTMLDVWMQSIYFMNEWIWWKLSILSPTFFILLFLSGSSRLFKWTIYPYHTRDGTVAYFGANPITLNGTILGVWRKFSLFINCLISIALAVGYVWEKNYHRRYSMNVDVVFFKYIKAKCGVGSVDSYYCAYNFTTKAIS